MKKNTQMTVTLVQTPMCSSVGQTYDISSLCTHVDSTKDWSENEDSDTQSTSDTVVDGEHFGFKIVGDNLDKTIRPRYQTAERQTQSLHFFHSYAVKDRIPSSHLSDVPPEPPSRVELDRIMPSESCHRSMLTTFAVLVSR